MSLKKTLAYSLIISIAIIAGLTVISLSREFAYFLEDLFDELDRSDTWYVIGFVYLGVLAIICAIVTRKSALKKGVIVLIVLIFVGTFLMRDRYYFYVSHDHPDFGDMQNVPECLKESNFATYWEFLNHGCHKDLGDLVWELSYKSITLIVVFILTHVFIKRLKKTQSKKANTGLIDEMD